ncbi:DUF692 domain-containing protein [Dongia sp.]|uniref:MNIO family bufferin maturase n=1 Tax=Dongia sp. TaxID=1977262 RepID=UPI0035B4AADF
MKGSTQLRSGIGLRAPHHQAVQEMKPAVGFLEAHPENYMGGGAARHALLKMRDHYPVSLHGVGLSLGGAEPVDAAHLGRLRELTALVEPFLVSEHIAWCRMDGVYLNDLLPLPYTEEALAILVDHVDLVQNHLKRRILMENPSAYVAFAHSPIPEGAFMAELARRSGCGLLLDVNNLHVNAHNLGVRPQDVMAELATNTVGEIHVAGHHIAEQRGRRILIDDHGGPVADPVWRLYRQAIQLFPDTVTLVEWDSNIPDLKVLVAEASEADAVRRDALIEAEYDRAG